MNLNRKLVITAVTAAVGSSLLTVAALRYDWNALGRVYSSALDWGRSLSQKILPLPSRDGRERTMTASMKPEDRVDDLAAQRLFGASSPWSLPEPGDLFSRMWRDLDDFSPMPGLRGFPGRDLWKAFGENAAGSSFEIHERDDAYVAELRLPGCDMKNVKATVNDHTLSVEAESRTEENENGGRTTGVVRHSRVLTLPGPVDVSGMKVEPEGDTLKVTLPKAAA